MTLFKKIFSILCSLFMALGMGITPVLATETEQASGSNTPEYSIEITNAIDGSVYTAYKIFDASSSANSNAVSYSIKTTSPIYSIISSKDSPFSLVATGDPSVYNVTISSSSSTSEVEWLRTYLEGEISKDDTILTQLPHASATATSASTVLIGLDGENLKAGYYYVRSDNEYTETSAITLSNATPKGEVKEKTTSIPTAANTYLKSAEPETANRGDVVTYTISFIALNNATESGVSKQITKYEVQDSSSAIYIDPKSIQINVKEYPTNYDSLNETALNSLQTFTQTIPSNESEGTDEEYETYSYASKDLGAGNYQIPFTLDLTTTKTPVGNTTEKEYTQSMEISLPWKDDSGNFLYPSRSLVTITYNAILKTSSNTAYTVGKNNTVVNYYMGANGTDEDQIDEEDHTVSVYSHRVEIDKEDGSGNALTGAKFGLVKADSNGDIIYKDEDAASLRDKYEFVTIYKDIDGNYTTDWKVAIDPTASEPSEKHPKSEEDAIANYACDIEVDENGKALIYGLKDTITTTSTTSQAEAAAANKLADYYLIELQAPAGYNLLSEEKAINIQSKTTTITYVDVVNTQGSVLPNTGGMGTKIFYVAGSLMVVGAVIFLITNRRMKSE
jgi:LPXTG-motif cell wall-anchored protein